MEKKTKKSFLIIATVFLVIFLISVSLFVGLNNQSDDRDEEYEKDDVADFYKFIGSWENYLTTITFSSDGSITYEMYYGTWELENGKLITIMSSEYITEERYIYDYSFSNDNKILTLIDDEGGVIVNTKIQS